MIRDLLTLLRNWRAGKLCTAEQFSTSHTEEHGLRAITEVRCQRIKGHPLHHRGVDMFDVERSWE